MSPSLPTDGPASWPREGGSPTPARVFAKEMGLVACGATRAQVQEPSQSLSPISLGAPGEEGWHPLS